MKIINNKYYSIIKTGIDTFKLTIKKTRREIEFKRDVNFMNKVQGSTSTGRINLILKLKEMGKTKDDFITRKEVVDENGKVKVMYDDSSFRYLEKSFIEEAAGLAMLNLMKEILNSDLNVLLLEMDIPTAEQFEIGQQFGKDFQSCMLEEQEKNPRSIAREKSTK